MVWWPFATKPERADTLEVIDLHSGAPLLYSTSFGRYRILKRLFYGRSYSAGPGQFPFVLDEKLRKLSYGPTDQANSSRSCLRIGWSQSFCHQGFSDGFRGGSLSSRTFSPLPLASSCAVRKR